MRSSPHQTNIGWREVRTMRTAVFRAWGQRSTGPSGVCDQSLRRMSSPNSPPPARKLGLPDASNEISRLPVNEKSLQCNAVPSLVVYTETLQKTGLFRDAPGTVRWLMSSSFCPASEIPVIETARLRLRGHRKSDFAACAALWADPVVTRYISGRPFTGEE